MKIENLTLNHYDEIVKLWKTDKNIRLGEADSCENMEKFINRNPDTNFILKEENKIIGTILCGHDGRRGYFHHLFIDSEYRNRGYGKILLEKGVNAFKKFGITKCHIFIAPENYEGQKFWERMGFYKREQSEFLIYSKAI